MSEEIKQTFEQAESVKPLTEVSKDYTPEELAEIEKERSETEQELFEEGADYKTDAGTGDKKLIATQEQIQKIHEDAEKIFAQETLSKSPEIKTEQIETKSDEFLKDEINYEIGKEIDESLIAYSVDDENQKILSIKTKSNIEKEHEKNDTDILTKKNQNTKNDRKLPFVNIAATYIDRTEKTNTLKNKAKAFEQRQEIKKWPEMYQRIIAMCADFINKDMADKYGFPKIIIDQEKIEKRFSLEKLSESKDGKVLGQFMSGGFIKISEDLIREQGPYSQTEILTAIGAIIHEMLHFSTVQITDHDKKLLRRFAIEFFKRPNDEELEGEFLFTELHDGIVEKIVNEEKHPEILFQRFLEQYPEYKDSIQNEPGKYKPAYENNIFLVDRLCNAIAVHDKNIPPKKLESISKIPYESRYESPQQVFEILKKATFGSGIGGLSYGRMINRIYGKGALDKFGALLKKTHPEENNSVTYNNEYKQPVNDVIDFLLSDKDGVINKVEEQNELRLHEFSQQITDKVLGPNEGDDIDKLLSEIKKLEFIGIESTRTKDEMEYLWDCFQKNPERGMRLKFPIDTPTKDDEEIFIKFLSENKRDLKKFLTLDKRFIIQGLKITESRFFTTLQMIFGENGMLKPESFQFRGNKKTGQAYYKKMFNQYLDELRETQSEETRRELSEQVKHMSDAYYESKTTGIIYYYDYDQNPDIKILIKISRPVPYDEKQRYHDITINFRKHIS